MMGFLKKTKSKDNRKQIGGNTVNKKSTKLLLLVALSIGLLFIPSNLVAAENVGSQIAQTTPEPKVIGINEIKVPFEFIQEQEEDIFLTGPYDASYFSFEIPNTWALKPEAELNLKMTVDFNKLSTDELGYPLINSGGSLIVWLNNTLLGVLHLNDIGEVEMRLPVPLEAFVSNRDDGRMAFYVELDSGDFCYVEEDFNLFIDPSSFFTLPHDIVAPVPDLIDFQGLLYQDSFVQESALIVLPDQPSEAELQAALTVAGTMGNISQNNLSIDTTTISALTPEQQTLNHLLFVGKPANFSVFDQFTLPAPKRGDTFETAEAGEDSGIIQLINSPWDISRMVLLVSGNSDEGVVKAAQALSTGVLRPHNVKNLAIVDEIQLAEETKSTVSSAVTRTFENMGYDDTLFQLRGYNAAAYGFQVPLGWTVSEDAYVELAYGFSSLIDYEQSGIIVYLNGSPIGSVRLDPEKAEIAVNKMKIDIPQNAVIPGVNTLEIQAYMFPYDICTPPDAQGMWVNIWKESVLSTPLTEKEADLSNTIDLTNYPTPFIFNSELNDTAFVLPQNDLEAWRGATQMASYLAYQTNPSIITLSAFYADSYPEEERANYHSILIGRPSQMPIIDELGDALPVGFEAGTDTAIEGNLRVIFNIPEDAPLGYIELLESPWNPDNIVLAVLGNSTQGEMWAATAINDAVLRSELSGNFVIVNDRQILASDTRVFPISSEEDMGDDDMEAPEISVMTTPESPEDTDSDMMPQNLDWIPVAIIVGVSLILLIIIIQVVSILQKRARNRSNNDIGE